MSIEHIQIGWGAALETDLRALLRMALSEDLGRGYDITSLSLVPREAKGRAEVVSRAEGIIAGLSTGSCLLDEMESTAVWTPLVGDGDRVGAGEVVATLHGTALDILAAERTLLNTLGHLSGISTLTRRFVDEIAGCGAKICDTRKTLPGWRRLEKFAVRCGGGINHRLGLHDAVLIKDNHLAFGRNSAVGNYTIDAAIRAARQFVETLDRPCIIEIEVDSRNQLAEALAAKPDIVLLDNMNTDQLVEAIQLRNRTAPDVVIEASGGVTLKTVRAIAETGVDRISVGMLTHSAPQLDLGLDWCPT